MDEVAEYFGIEDYDYDLNGYTWTSGCYVKRCDSGWLSLKKVVLLIEHIEEMGVLNG